jgi:hypothetical protein
MVLVGQKVGPSRCIVVIKLQFRNCKDGGWGMGMRYGVMLSSQGFTHCRGRQEEVGSSQSSVEEPPGPGFVKHSYCDRNKMDGKYEESDII